MSKNEQIKNAINRIDSKLNSTEALNQVNDLIQFMNVNLNCDSQCQKEKEIESLREKWTKSKNELKDMPSIVNTNEKKYYIAAEGIDYYNNDILKNRYLQEISKWSQAERNNFSDIYEIMQTKLKSYEIETYSSSKLKQLFEELTQKSEKLKTNIDNYYAKSRTNARKVWYEDQDIEKLEYIQKILKIFYFGVFFGYIIFSGFIKNAEYKNKKVVLLLLIYLSIPFILKHIISFTLDLIYNYKNKAPS